VVKTAMIEGLGTPEVEWRTWLDHHPFAGLELEAASGRDVVVVAAHPDDEVLGVGGLLRRLADAGSALTFVWATDGEASHPQSQVYTRPQLASLRRGEAGAAIGALGLRPRATHHLGLPDGELSANVDELTAALREVTGPDALVLAPWRHDGHPDHEATGRAADAVEAWECWQYPIWMWHWAAPRDGRVPWDTAHRSEVADPVGKAQAIAMFGTQVAAIGPAPEDAAILPPHVVARFTRRFEVVFT
jgi:LmbE family N-acetylglucosaminyl deacetylase